MMKGSAPPPRRVSRAALLLVSGVTLVSVLTPQTALATAAGALDTTFGVGGKVTTDLGSAVDYARAALIQSDGKIVVIGESGEYSSYDFTLARYNTDGSLDTSFDGDGKVSTSIGLVDSGGLAGAVQPDGKIVAAGWVDSATWGDFALLRYNADGSLDTSFGGDGIVTTDLGPRSDEAWAVALQPDGKIVAAGGTNYGVNDDFAVVRYNADGSLDTSFGGDGIVTTDFGDMNDQAYSVAIQTDGKIVAAGVFGSFFVSDFALARYNADGTLDTSFGGDGKVITDFGFNQNTAQAVAIQTDGKIVAGGAGGATGQDMALARYNTDGSLDTSFDGDGKVTSDFNPSWISSLALQTDGKIVTAGTSIVGVHTDFVVARYMNDGSFDSSFDGDGWLMTEFGGIHDSAHALAIQPDGNVVVAGWADMPGTGYDFGVARYTGVGSGDITPPDTTIDSGPSGTVASASAAFTFSGSDPGGSGIASFQCELDSGLFASCTSPKSYAGLSDGSHTFQVRAIDVEANVDPTATSRTWTIDTTPPPHPPPPPSQAKTSLSIKAPASVKAGSNATVKGRLSSTSSPCVRGQTISLNGGGTTKTSGSGAYKFSVTITKPETVQAIFKGTSSCAGSKSPRKTINTGGLIP